MTAVSGKWQINDFRIEPDVMHRHGFDDYLMWTGWESDNGPSAARYYNPYIHTRDGSQTYNGVFGPDLYSGFLLDFIRKNKDRPFCVYYSMTLPHIPFTFTPDFTAADIDEFIAGTDPKDADSGFVISTLQIDDGLLRVYFTSAWDRSYTLYGTTNLLSGWTPIATNLRAPPPISSGV